MTALTDGEREALLTPCGCGHSINDHGTLCWVCADNGCSRDFEELLVERLGGIVAGRTKVRLAGVEALADEWVRFDSTTATVPSHVDVPDDYEAGVNNACYALRAALAGAGVGDGGGGEA